MREKSIMQKQDSDCCFLNQLLILEYILLIIFGFSSMRKQHK
jgi:hypothetical protein